MATADPAHLEARVRAAELSLAARYGRTLVEHVIPTRTGSRLRVVEYPPVGTPSKAAGNLPPIMLLHGIASTTALAAPLLVALAGRRVLAVDWPGHGLSGVGVIRPDSNVRDDAVAVVELVFGAFDLERVDLIGHSLGGQVALYAALAHPEKVRRLVLLGAPGAAFSQARPTLGMRRLTRPPSSVTCRPWWKVHAAPWYCFPHANRCRTCSMALTATGASKCLSRATCPSRKP